MKRILITLVATLAAANLGLAQQAGKPKGTAPVVESPKTATKAPEAKGSENKDEAAIRETADRFLKAFAAGDAAGVAALWTPEGEYITEDGQLLRGRATIEKQYAAFFKEHPKAHLALTIDSIRMIGSDLAIEDGRASMLGSANAQPTTNRYTVIHIKKDGKWQMASVRDMPADATTNSDVTANLGWLIGTWEVETRGVELVSHYQWIANKNFIEQSFTSRKDGHVVSSGKQVIGWDPRYGQITSWVFTSDGGHSVGRWIPVGNGWRIELEGVLADGSPTSAVNLIQQLDDKAMSWQSVNRSVGSFRVLDTDEVVIKRKESK